MTEDGDDGAETVWTAAFSGPPRHESSAGFSTSREENIFGEDDQDEHDKFGPSLDQLNGYPSNVDYYAVLGLPRSLRLPTPKFDLRSASCLLTFILMNTREPSSW